MNSDNQSKKGINSKKLISNQNDSSFGNNKNKKNGTQSHKNILQTQNLKYLKIIPDGEVKSTTTQKHSTQINIIHPTIKSEPLFKKSGGTDFKNVISFEREFSNNKEINHVIESNLNNQNINISYNKTNNNINNSSFQKYDINLEIAPKNLITKEIHSNQKLPVMIDIEMKDNDNINNITFNNLLEEEKQEKNKDEDIEMKDESSMNFKKRNSYNNLVFKVSHALLPQSPLREIKYIKYQEQYYILVKKIASRLKIKTKPANYNIFKIGQYRYLVKKIADGLRRKLKIDKVNHFYYKTLIRKIAMKLKEKLNDKKVFNFYYKTLIRKISMKLKEKLNQTKLSKFYYKTLVRKIAMKLKEKLNQTKLSKFYYKTLVRKIAMKLKEKLNEKRVSNFYYKTLIRKIGLKMRISLKIKERDQMMNNKRLIEERKNDIEMEDQTQNNLTENTYNLEISNRINNNKLSFSNPNDVNMNINYPSSKRVSIENSALNDTTFDINVNASNIEKLKELNNISKQKNTYNNNDDYEMKDEIQNENIIPQMKEEKIIDNKIPQIFNSNNQNSVKQLNIISKQNSEIKPLNILNQNSEKKLFNNITENSEKKNLNITNENYRTKGKNTSNNKKKTTISPSKIQIKKNQPSSNQKVIMNKILTPSKNSISNQLNSDYFNQVNGNSYSKSKPVTPSKFVFPGKKASNKNNINFKEYINSISKKGKIIERVEEEKNNNENPKLNASKMRLTIQLQNLNSSSQNFVQDFETFLSEREIKIKNLIPHESGLNSLGILSRMDFWFLLMDYLVIKYKINIINYIEIYTEFSKYSRTKEELQQFKIFFYSNLLRHYTSEEIKSQLYRLNINFDELNIDSVCKLIPEPKLKENFDLVESKRIKIEEMEKNENFHKNLSKCIHKIILENRNNLIIEQNLNFEINNKYNPNDNNKIDSINSILIKGKEKINIEKRDISTSPFSSEKKTKKEIGISPIKLEQNNKNISTSPIKMIDEEIDVNINSDEKLSSSSEKEDCDTPKFSAKKINLEENDNESLNNKVEESKNFLNEIAKKIEEEEISDRESEKLDDEKEKKNNKKSYNNLNKKKKNDENEEESESEDEDKKKKIKKKNINMKKKKSVKKIEEEEKEKEDSKNSDETLSDEEDKKKKNINKKRSPNKKKTKTKKSEEAIILSDKNDSDDEEEKESENENKKKTKGRKTPIKKRNQSKKRNK